MPTTKMIQPWQRSRIFGIARDLGMTTKSDDKSDDLHLLIESRTGKGSLTQLTYDDANSILGELNHNQRFGCEVTPSPQKFAFTEKPGGISSGQYKKIVALMCELRKLDSLPSRATIEQRVAGIVRRELKMTAPEDNPYAWLTYRHGRKLIEIIKGYLDTAQRKAGSEVG